MRPGVPDRVLPAVRVDVLEIRPFSLPIQRAELAQKPVEHRLSVLPGDFSLPEGEREPYVARAEIAVERSGKTLHGVDLVLQDLSDAGLLGSRSPPDTLAASRCRHPDAADLLGPAGDDLVLHDLKHSFFLPGRKVILLTSP